MVLPLVLLSHPVAVAAAAMMLTDTQRATTDNRREATDNRVCWKGRGEGETGGSRRREMGLDTGQKPLSETNHPSSRCGSVVVVVVGLGGGGGRSKGGGG